MVLGDEWIAQLIKTDNLLENFDNDLIGPASVDLRLGDSFIKPKKKSYYKLFADGVELDSDYEAIRLGDHVEYEECTEKTENGRPGIVIRPGQFILATTMEKVNLPLDIAAFVQGRSSIGRIGLTTQNAGFVDPGFTGHITLELINESCNYIELVPGYPVAQLVFMWADSVLKPYTGKYNGQVKATGSRMNLDRVVAKND